MAKPEQLLPLKPVVFDILLILNEGELHGYGLAQSLSESTGKRVLPGNLYRTLSGMIDLGVVAKSPRRAAAGADDERRRYFRITPFGRRVAKAEAERLRDRLAVATAQRLLSR